MNWTLIKAIIKAKRNGLLHLVPATEPTHLDCLAEKCALCCKTIGAPVLTEDEAKKIPAQLTARSKSGVFVKSHNCICCLLKDGLCSLYADRPTGCREYPWYNINGRLFYDKGCPGIKHDKDEHPDIDGIEPFENFFPQTTALTLWLVKKICVKK